LEKPDLIKFIDLKRQYQGIRQQVLDAVDSVLTSGQVLDGPNVEGFEEAIARMTNRKYAVAVNSGTQALIFAIKAAGAKAIKNKILIPSISFVATLNSVLESHNTPVFCDVDPQALMDISSLTNPFGPRSFDAVMYVNIFGNTLDYEKFYTGVKFFGNENIPIIEDAAQSLGAKYKGIPSGKLGDISILSFDPTKNLPNYGSGGMILTDDVSEYTVLRDLRDNGKYDNFARSGTNSKMSELDAALMLVKLGHFAAWQKRRTDIANYYSQELKDYVQVPEVTRDCEPSWHKYVIKDVNRSSIKSHLLKNNIETKIHYDTPLFDLPLGFGYADFRSTSYSNATLFSRTCLSLPIYPELRDVEVEKIVNEVKTGASRV
jgi:dTDP-4-amino-4,6-dideoxygalactose transaminase